jgi:galactokinase
MTFDELQLAFKERYQTGEGNLKAVFAPGRINLIGEHTDYNGGYVLPCAISNGTWLLAQSNSGGVLRFLSLNFSETAEIPIDKIGEKSKVSWVNYPLGVINQLLARGLKLTGLDMLFYGNIPNGAGLSSSASIEVATATLLNHCFNLGINDLEIVKLSQKAEVEFVGVNCGIMDQFAVTINRKNHALFLDCRTLDFELVPLAFDGYKIVICNTGIKRQLAQSKYNERVAECAKAIDFIKQVHPVDYLGQLTLSQYNSLKHLITDSAIRRRVTHVVTENQRVLDAVNALKNGNIKLFGSLMNASHHSLRYDYEVTGKELDVMVEEALKVDGVLGARMTGAGFGGCAITILNETAVDSFIDQVGERYKNKTGFIPEFYISETNDGAKMIFL